MPDTYCLTIFEVFSDMAFFPSVANVSSTNTLGSYKVGSAISIQVTFNGPVDVIGTPLLALALGASKQASFTDLDGTARILTFSYVVQAGDSSADLDFSSATALQLNGGTIRAQGTSNDASLTLPNPGDAGSLGANAQLVIDGVVPVAPAALALQAASDSGLFNSDRITAVDAPIVTGTAEVNSTVTLYDTDGTTPLGSTVVNNTGAWSITSSTLAAGTHLFTAKAVDAAGNISPASTALGVTVDTNAPTVVSIERVSSAPTNASSVQYSLHFNESITGVGTSDFILSSSGGSASGNIAAVTGSGLTYTITVDGLAGDGPLRLDVKSAGTGITDIAGNALPSGFTAGQVYTLDHTAPSVTSVSVPANATYSTGQNLDFTVNFSEAVTVNATGGTPSVNLTLDTGGTVQAAYFDGSVGSGLTFRYVVAASNADLDGVTLGALNLNGATIKDGANNDATLTLNSVASTSGVLIGAPAVPPLFSSAAVNGNTLVVSYIEATTLDAAHLPAAGAYNVLVGGVANVVTGLTIDALAKTATLTLTTPVTAGQSVTVAYNDPTVGNDINALQNAAGTDAASFSAAAVTNNTVAPPVVPPVSGGITVTAPVNGGVLNGTPFADTFVGSSSKDTFHPAGGADSVDGGAGVDTVILAGTRAQFGITHQADGSFSVRSLTDSNSVVTVKNVERLTFDNQTIALDVTPTSSRVAELYHLTLGRNPEENGLGFYVGVSGQGLSTAQLALNFVSSAEFTKLYGAPNNTTFVTQLYQNAFGRAPDAEGLAFHVAQLAKNPGAAGLANVIANFVDSPEMAIKLAGVVDQGIPLYG